MAGRKKAGHGRALRYEPDPVFDRIIRPVRVENDLLEEAEALFQASIKPNLSSKLSPKGTCYDCGLSIGPDRKFCGPCLNKHDRHRR